MVSPAEQPVNKSNSYAWVGLTVGFLLLVAVVWANSSDSVRRKGHGNPDVVELTTANWKKEVLDSKIPVVVDFWAPWCSPCVKFAPTIDKLATSYTGRVKFCKLNVDEAVEIAEKMGVSGIPVVMIFRDGKLATDPLVGEELFKNRLPKVIDGVLARLN